MNPLVRQVIGESMIDDVFAYMERIKPALESAKAKALAHAVNEAQRGAIEQGHGRYVGNCGHNIKQCRCAANPAYPHPRIEVDAPCRECYA